MKILVTGAAGFIGSYVSRALVNRGDDVVGIDNFSDYYKKDCKLFNLDLLSLNSGSKAQFFDSSVVSPVFSLLQSYYSGTSESSRGAFKFVEADILDFDKINNIFQTEKPDAVIHLAAMAGVPLSVKYPRLYSNVNVNGTTNLLEASKLVGLKKFVFGSSSSVYGDRGGSVVKETDDVMHAASPYGATKVAGEVLCHSASVVYGIPVVIDRIFGPIYGPLQRPYGMMMQRAINYTYNGKKVQIYGRKGMDSAKDSTYIDDQVTGILKCLDHSTQFDVFNIGTSDPRSIRDWFTAIEKSFGKPVQYEVVDVDKGDVASSADISKARSLLGYNPAMKLEEGVKRQVEVFNLMPEWYKTLSEV